MPTVHICSFLRNSEVHMGMPCYSKAENTQLLLPLISHSLFYFGFYSSLQRINMAQKLNLGKEAIQFTKSADIHYIGFLNSSPTTEMFRWPPQHCAQPGCTVDGPCLPIRTWGNESARGRWQHIPLCKIPMSKNLLTKWLHNVKKNVKVFRMCKKPKPTTTWGQSRVSLTQKRWAECGKRRAVRIAAVLLLQLL